MSQTNLQSYCPSFEPAAAYAANINVYIATNGKATVAPKGTAAVGTTARACDPADADLQKQRVAVLPFSGSNCGKHISAAACVAYAAAYQADDGLVDDVSTDAIKLGTFLTGASGAGQEVDILYDK